MYVGCDSIHNGVVLTGKEDVKSVQLGLVALTLVDLKNFLSLLATYKISGLALEFSMAAILDEFDPATLFEILVHDTLVRDDAFILVERQIFLYPTNIELGVPSLRT